MYCLIFLEYNAFEVVNWADQHKKRGATELLMMEVMNIEGSCYEDDEDGNERERERQQANKKELTGLH